MNKYWFKKTALITSFALLAPALLKAQDDKEDKGDKGDKQKRETQNIIVTTKGDHKEKITIEINGDKITVNGKPLEEFKDRNGDISVNVSKLKSVEGLSYFRSPGQSGAWSFNGNDGMSLFSGDENRAMLGVTSEKVTEGAEIQSVKDGSAADKAGLKENDIITKVGDKKIESPDDLSEAIKKQKPGDKVNITYLRDKKEQKATAELGKWKGLSAYSLSPGSGSDFNLKLNEFPKLKENMIAPFDTYRGYARSNGTPRLGLSVQDTDDGKGVKVIGVDDESNAAKAGIKEDDVITQLDDKAVNNVDEISTLLKSKKDNPTVRFQISRNGKTQNIEVKMPRKIKTTNL